MIVLWFLYMLIGLGVPIMLGVLGFLVFRDALASLRSEWRRFRAAPRFGLRDCFGMFVLAGVTLGAFRQFNGPFGWFVLTIAAMLSLLLAIVLVFSVRAIAGECWELGQPTRRRRNDLSRGPVEPEQVADSMAICDRAPTLDFQSLLLDAAERSPTADSSPALAMPCPAAPDLVAGLLAAQGWFSAPLVQSTVDAHLTPEHAVHEAGGVSTRGNGASEADAAAGVDTHLLQPPDAVQVALATQVEAVAVDDRR